MTMHLYGMILTPQGIFANNRGENEGNSTTLQKVLRNGEQYTTVSAEAIRYAMRAGWQEQMANDKNIRLNRTAPDHRHVQYADKEFSQWSSNLDDDVMGFMHAKEETLSRRGVLEITRAISISPWRGELMNNFASPGSNPASGDNNPIPYAVEMHDTRYQYGFAMTPEALGREGNSGESRHSNEEKSRRIRYALDGFLNLRRVGGNHARYFADYSPEVIVLRWTSDPAPRFLYCFEQDQFGSINLKSLLKRVENGDIVGNELVVGTVCEIPEIETLQSLDVCVKPGVKAAVDDLVHRIEKQLAPTS